jgi:Tfp pilus assembly protein PilV
MKTIIQRETAVAGWLRRWPVAAFTLVEVMIAVAILCACVFAILSVVGTGLRGARVLQQPDVDPSMMAGLLSLTNKLTEGSDSGDFETVAPGMYPGYTWNSDTYEVSSNGLFKIDLMVRHTENGKPQESTMSFLLYRPESGSSIGGIRGFGR